MNSIMNIISRQFDRTVRVLSKFPTVEKIIDDTTSLIDLVGAYRSNRYRDVSWGTIGLIIFGVIYFISPIDIFPDFIYALGLIDDIAILGFIATALADELERFRYWQKAMKEQYDTVQQDSSETVPLNVES